MKRRNFLRTSGIVSLAGPASFTSLTPSYSGSETANGFSNWSDVRSQFNLRPDLIHMSQMFLASHPASVRQAIDHHRKQLDIDPYTYWEDHYFKFEDMTIQAASKYTGGKPEEIALIPNTTTGLAMIYSGFRLKAGDEILTSVHDHFVTFFGLDYAVEKTGATLNRISLYDQSAQADAEQIVTRISKAITPATRLVALTWVHSSTGVKLPIRLIADEIKRVNQNRDANRQIYFSVDGVHGFGNQDVNIPDLGCDYFIASAHKWIFGPRGTGILWARKDAWDQIIPTIPPFSLNVVGPWAGMISGNVMANFSDKLSPGGFVSYENHWALKDAFDWQMNIGKSRICNRTKELNTLLKKEMSQLTNVNLLTPISSDLSAGINCFEVKGLKPEETVQKLKANKIIASTSPYKISYARLTPSIVNNESEVLRCIKVLAGLK